jgi:hypothetical protein
VPSDHLPAWIALPVRRPATALSHLGTARGGRRSVTGLSCGFMRLAGTPGYRGTVGSAQEVLPDRVPMANTPIRERP